MAEDTSPPAGPRDSVDAELADWLAPMDGADAATEAARQRIGRISRQFERVLAGVAADNRLSVGDWATLSALRRGDPPGARTPTELARALEVTSGTMSVRLERLTAAGLVAAVPHADGRSRPVRLTDLGRRRWAEATAQRAAAEHRLIGDALPPEELHRLNGLLAALLGRLESELGPASRHDTPRHPRG